MSNNDSNFLKGLTLGGLTILTGAVVLVGTKFYNKDNGEEYVNDTTIESDYEKETISDVSEELGIAIEGEEVVETKEESSEKKDVKTIAYEIVYGVNGVNPWGNGQDRINNLKAKNYTEEEIREIQREIDNLIDKSKKVTKKVDQTDKVNNKTEDSKTNDMSNQTNNVSSSSDTPSEINGSKLINVTEKTISENTEQKVISETTTTEEGKIISQKDEVIGETIITPDNTKTDNDTSKNKQEENKNENKSKDNKEKSTSETHSKDSQEVNKSKEETTNEDTDKEQGNDPKIISYNEEITDEVILPESVKNENNEWVSTEENEIVIPDIPGYTFNYETGKFEENTISGEETKTR